MNTTWQAPSNIALIKYWGKLPEQRPMNASLSLTLKNCYTQCRAEKSEKYSLFVSNKEMQSNHKFYIRIKEYIDYVRNHYGVKSDAWPIIHTHNSFPHSAGIASSASVFASLAACLNEFYALDLTEKELTSLARMGSGSACRSLLGGVNFWGQSDHFAEGHNEHSVRMPESLVHEEFKNLRNCICIVSSKEKKMSSSKGHELMMSHPYQEGRVKQVNENMQSILSHLKTGDWDGLSSVVENEALSLHALINSSIGGEVLLRPESLSLIEKINNFRDKYNCPLTYTLDAGPNIHLIYKEQDKNLVLDFIKNQCFDDLENGKYIDDEISDKGLSQI